MKKSKLHTLILEICLNYISNPSQSYHLYPKCVDNKKQRLSLNVEGFLENNLEVVRIICYIMKDKEIKVRLSYILKHDTAI